MNNNHGQILKTKAMQTMKKRRLLFYVLGISIPLLQFAVMYVYVNFDSFLLAFQKFNMFGENAGKYTWNGFNNFKELFGQFKEHEYLRDGIWRGFLIYLFNIAQIPLHILIAWYAVKHKPFASAAHIILYIPSILSSMVCASITKYMLCEAAPAAINQVFGGNVTSLLDSGNYMQTFWVILGDVFVMGVISNLLLYAGTMNSISESVLEAGELDGVTPWQEFWHIYMPLISPTIVTLFVIGLSGIMTADIGLFAYWGESAPVQLYTLGYYLTVNTKKATMSTYPFVSTIGVSIMLVVIPVTLIGRKICYKIVGRFE